MIPPNISTDYMPSRPIDFTMDKVFVPEVIIYMDQSYYKDGPSGLGFVACKGDAVIQEMSLGLDEAIAFQSEILAIQAAAEWTRTYKQLGSIKVISDSMSAIAAIKAPNATSMVVWDAI